MFAYYTAKSLGHIRCVPVSSSTLNTSVMHKYSGNLFLVQHCTFCLPTGEPIAGITNPKTFAFVITATAAQRHRAMTTLSLDTTQRKLTSDSRKLRKTCALALSKDIPDFRCVQQLNLASHQCYYGRLGDCQ